MKVALVTTIKNERDILGDNIRYHRHLGVDEVFVFLDGTTDDTAATVAGLPNVHVQQSVFPDSFRGVPEYAIFVEQWDAIFTARQSLNTIVAIEMARQRGCDWLIALDADELVCPDPRRVYPGQLKDLLAAQPAGIQTVLFGTYEIVQHRMDYGHVFSEECLFKCPGNAIRKRIRDPIHGGSFTIAGFYGQKAGKSALRLAVDARPKNSHKFVAINGRRLETAQVGCLLHYYCHAYRYFISKYRGMARHPDHYQGGPMVEYQKRLWRDLVNHPGFSDEDLRAYFRRWVLFSDREIAKYRRTRRWWRRVDPAIVEITTAREVFAALLQNGQPAGNENKNG